MFPAQLRPPRPLVIAAERLEHDLRTRFPDTRVQWRQDTEGTWWCEVAGGAWPTPVAVSTAFHQTQRGSQIADEAPLVGVTAEVADNLWPDEDMEPWPLCPMHADHPLSPRIGRRRAAWVCWRDPTLLIEIGRLPEPSGIVPYGL